MIFQNKYIYDLMIHTIVNQTTQRMSNISKFIYWYFFVHTLVVLLILIVFDYGYYYWIIKIKKCQNLEVIENNVVIYHRTYLTMKRDI
jgi:hypothetical protein